MPCRCDEEEPTARQRESRVVCRLLQLILNELHHPISISIIEAANSSYGNTKTLDADTDQLCTLIKGFKPAQKKIYLDFSIKKWRPLAQWWEDHQEADKKREAAERAKVKKDKLRKQALAKLTPAERKALLE